jgi:rare lipoprotein A
MKKYLFIFVIVLINAKSNHFYKLNRNFNLTETKLVSTIETGLAPNNKLSVHSATWYYMHGHMTASGERFHKDSLTAAYNFAKFGEILKVTNLSNGLSVLVKVTDRMNNKQKNRIDLSRCAFDSIANLSSGRISVSVEELIEN